MLPPDPSPLHTCQLMRIWSGDDHAGKEEPKDGHVSGESCPGLSQDPQTHTHTVAQAPLVASGSSKPYSLTHSPTGSLPLASVAVCCGPGAAVSEGNASAAKNSDEGDSDADLRSVFEFCDENNVMDEMGKKRLRACCILGVLGPIS